MAEGRRSRGAIAVAILSKIADGSLPAISVQKVWAGHGTRRVCYACEEPVTAQEVENEVEMAGAVVLVLHAECFRAWQAALPQGREISGGSGQLSTWTERLAAHHALLAASVKVCTTARKTRAQSRRLRRQRTHRAVAAGLVRLA
jgi:hypothetical protein